MSAGRTLSRNIFSNTFGHVVNVVTFFFLTPYVVDALGDRVAGVWLVLVALVGHYGLLDLGIRSAVGYFVAAAWAKRDQEGVNRTLSTALAFLVGIAALTTLVSVGLFSTLTQSPQLLGDWVRELSAGELQDTRLALLIMGVGYAVNFPMMTFNGVLYATQRIDLQNAIGVSQTLLRAGLTVWVLGRGFGIVGIASVTVLCLALGWITAMFFAYRVIPGLTLRPWRPSRETFRPLLRYGFFNSLVNVGDIVLNATDALVIAVLVPLAVTTLYDPAEAVTYYNFGALLIPHTMSLVTAITWTFTPYATACHATGDLPALRRLIHRGSRGTLALGTVFATGFLLLGEDFLRQWVGEKYLTGDVYPSSATILGILAIAFLFRAKESCNRQILFGTNRVRFLGLLALFEVAVNLVLSAILILHFGPVGVAFGTLIPVVLTQGVIQPWFVAREFQVSLGSLARGAFRGIAPVMAAMTAVNTTAHTIEGIVGMPLHSTSRMRVPA